MRSESPVLAWLLVALAAASWSGWVLAYWSGTRDASLAPVDPALIPAISSPATTSPPPIANSMGNTGTVKRPLFFEERRPRTFFLPGKEADAKTTVAFDYELTSVMMTPDLEMAILQPKGGGEPVRVKRGESVPAATGWKLAALQPRHAVFEGQHGRRELELRVFAGVPIPVPAPAASPAATAAPAAVVPSQTVASEPPAQSNVSVSAAASGGAMTEDAIRKRIEQRRAQARRAADAARTSRQ